MGSSSSTPNTGAGPQPATLDDDPTLAAAGLDVAVFTIFPQLVDAFAALTRAAGGREAGIRAWALVHGLAHLMLDGALPGEVDLETLLK